MSMMDCSIIIPAYNKASLTVQCLDTLLSRPRAGASFEIIVVDNGSTDVTPHALSGYGDSIRVLTQSVNSGFSTICNLGAAAARGKHLVFLNNDTIPQIDWLDELVEYAESHPRAAAIGSKLLYLDGTIQHAGLVIAQDRFPRHIYAGFPADHPAVNKSREFQMVTAACMLIKRGPFEQIGGFDTVFWHGYEDVDLCLRLRELGHEVHFCHRSLLYHLESVSEDRFKRVDENTRIYRDRWAHRVRPDDLQYYADDGLIGVDHEHLYPIRLSVTPELALIDSGSQMSHSDRILNKRAKQVFALLRENTALTVRAMEAEQQTFRGSHQSAGHRNGKATFQRSARLNEAVDLDRKANGLDADFRALTDEPRLLFEGKVRWRTGPPSERVISVIMPVKDAAGQLRKILPRILTQKTRDALEIVAVDSGSSDDTVEVLRDASATVVSIHPMAFNHGLTRNLGAAYARGQVLVYLNKNSTPADDLWLANLVAPLDADSRVAAVCSRVLPGPDADLLTRKDGMNDLSASPHRRVQMIHDRDAYERMPHHEFRAFINFHTVSAAIRADVLRQVPFRKVETIGEDIVWSKEVLEAGYKIQHEPASVVLHSHNFSPLEFLQLNVDDGMANRGVVGRELPDSEVYASILALVRDDWRYLESECHLGADELEKCRVDSVLRRAGQMLGQWIGVNKGRMPAGLAQMLSRVNQTRAGGAFARLG
ncbi:N-acetylglucosaminyl-diphospho-decaprenol L-rhamnosyltransferase [Aquisphaera giovannonii]|uniref:N-acetylglucosaminyl-diphospho-decaprenol L-rhamnosyltransferase n=1 Tax=Aquisphaera giovannonii TaxID=406548 RepID=A0A5B9WA33_9BACT|nr:glycosyltransferase family 2 protein [Aquisphaera giovannonii]QEH36941.1 N-acetylglucosaminyl-diphospho-decaprenol L-rhamnosyltransferase [Aquisphaera giovannonii]